MKTDYDNLEEFISSYPNQHTEDPNPFFKSFYIAEPYYIICFETITYWEYIEFWDMEELNNLDDCIVSIDFTPFLVKLGGPRFSTFRQRRVRIVQLHKI